MADPGPRYGFSPLERRGVLLGLQPAQLAGMGAALAGALVVRAVLGGAIGSAAAVLVGGAGVAAALWSIDGRPAGAVAWTWMRWVARRATGPRLSPVPLDGHPGLLQTGAGALAPGGRGRRRRPVRWPAADRSAARWGPARGIELEADAGGPGEVPVGVVRDRSAATCSAVVPVGGRSFNLLDPGQQASSLEAWRSVLGAAARSGTPVVRLQWLQRRGVLGLPPALPDAGIQTPATAGYAQLVDETRLATCGPDTWLVVAVRARGAASGRVRSAGRRPPGMDGLRRELRLLEGQLRAAGLEPGDPLDRRGVADLLSGAYVAAAGMVPAGEHRSGGDGAPLAVEEDWGAVRVDGCWHCTYWVAEWPRVEVGPDFLAPLLMGAGRRRVSVVMAPVPGERALREVRSARTADLADAELRGRAGFLSSARREREAQGVNRREEELADGHSEYRFSGYVTVSADDCDGLAAACSEVEHAAQSARLELRRLWGRQAEAYTWTLPLARGLR